MLVVTPEVIVLTFKKDTACPLREVFGKAPELRVPELPVLLTPLPRPLQKVRAHAVTVPAREKLVPMRIVDGA